jgi:hypothetical protein
MVSAVAEAKVPYLKRPATVPGLRGFPIEVIEDAQFDAWNRSYNNFLYNDDECFDRAVDVIAGLQELMEKRGVSFPLRLGEKWTLENSNVAKLYVIFPRTMEPGSYLADAAVAQWVWRYRWRFHIITVLRDSDNVWHPIDPGPDGKSPATPEDWVSRIAVDIHGNPAKVTGLSLGKFYNRIPADGEVYVYWMPADAYGILEEGPNAKALKGYSVLDPIEGSAAARGNLVQHRNELLKSNPDLRLSGADREVVSSP